jgi:hypothetical protein
MAVSKGTRTCEPCRNGCDRAHSYDNSGKPILNRDVCSSRALRCHHRRAHLKGRVG